jgi:hypothetical protein
MARTYSSGDETQTARSALPGTAPRHDRRPAPRRSAAARRVPLTVTISRATGGGGTYPVMPPTRLPCASGGAERRWRVSASRAAIGALPLPGERDTQDVNAVDTLKVPGIGCSYPPSCGDGGRGHEPVVRSDVLAGGGELGPDAGVAAAGPVPDDPWARS